MEETHWEIRYHPKVDSEDISRVDLRWLRDAERAIRKKLATDPYAFGKSLRHSLKGVRSLRVGDYRVAFCIEKMMVKILVIAHRSKVYEILQKRL